MTPDSTTTAYWIEFLKLERKLSRGTEFPYWSALRLSLNAAELTALKAAADALKMTRQGDGRARAIQIHLRADFKN